MGPAPQGAPAELASRENPSIYGRFGRSIALAIRYVRVELAQPDHLVRQGMAS